MGAIAFTLREEFAGTVEQDGEQVPAFTGGVIRVDDDRDVSLRDALDEGNGFIVVEEDDAPLVTVLTEAPVLKRVPVPEGADVINPYAGRLVRDLRAEAKLRDLRVEAGVNAAALANGLLAHDRLLEAGAPVSPTDERVVTLTDDGAIAVADSDGNPIDLDAQPSA